MTLLRSVLWVPIIHPRRSELWTRYSARTGGATVLAAWQARQPALHAYYSALNAERDPASVLRTLLHEHHIRAVGVDPELQRKASRLPQPLPCAVSPR